MLELILGRAGSGKTRQIFAALARRVRAGQGGNILIVPEQFSHDAERELARLCPPEACLYAEVLSFSRLAGRVFAEVGGLARKTLDRGGRTLAMSRAVSESAAYLEVYGYGSGKPDFLEGLLHTYDELRAAGAGVETLRRAAGETGAGLEAKLRDLTLIFESYERLKEASGLDPTDRLDRLAEALPGSTLGEGGHFYIDGFTDFTAQEQRVLSALLKMGRALTVALGCPGLEAEGEAFQLPAETARRLRRTAEKHGVPVSLRLLEAEGEDRDPALRFLERTLMDTTEERYPVSTAAIALYSPASPGEECMLAAARIRALVEQGARYRDIAVVSPAWQSYAALLGGMFTKCNIPFNASDKADITEKPVLLHVTAALDIAASDFSLRHVLRYLKTGLTGLTEGETDLLENYLLTWNLRGHSRWSQGDWKMHPEGYRQGFTEANAAHLEAVNLARQTLSAPLLRLWEGLRREEEAGGKIRVLYAFLEDSGLYGRVEEKVNRFRATGRLRLADEYAQLWDILTGALTQAHDMLGHTRLTTEELTGLLKLVLSRYDVATIPSSVDAVGIGDMARMRGRGIRHLIVLGATDAALPAAQQELGLFTEEERLTLRERGIGLPDPENDTLARELGRIYSSFTLPTASLTLSWPATSRPSYLVTRIERLFALTIHYPGPELLLCAPRPALELAARDDSPASRLAKAALERTPEAAAELQKLALAAAMPRGRLSHLTAERLYGKRLTLSASRIDKFYSCRYLYFLQYGLRLRPRAEAALDAPETGTFIHYILEKTAAQVGEEGGFARVEDERLREMTRQWAAEYAATRLGGLEDKSGRFRYLFSRLTQDAERIVLTMAEELRVSDFVPMDFELKFGPAEALPPAETANGVRVVGSVDRVDGWVHEGKLYLRVVDYKTGKKAFKLSDVYNGLNLQMLLYLFTLEREGRAYYGKEIVPAGVLYSPARDPILSVPHNMEGEELEKERKKLLRRSGLFRDEAALLEAMDRSGTGEYLPVNLKRPKDSLATAEELGALERHIALLVSSMGDELRGGSLRADPYFRSQRDIACTYCAYFGACHFGLSEGDKHRYVSGLSSPAVWAKLKEESR